MSSFLVPPADLAILRLRLGVSYVLVCDDDDGDRRFDRAFGRGECIAAACGECYDRHPIVYERTRGRWKRIFGKEWRL